MSNLHGAVNDATAMSEVLATHEDGSPNYECRLYTSQGPWPVTRATVRGWLSELFRESPDSVLFYFAGHGSPTETGGVILTQDAEKNDLGISMTELLELANKSKAREVFLILDCCFSGSLGNPASIQGAIEDRAILREGVTILAASRPTETSTEIGGKGVFTSLVLHALYGGAKDVLGNVSAAAVYAHVEQALGSWDQRPLFKSHASKLSPIRRCEPDVPLPILRLLPKIFSDSMANVTLDPSYEPTATPPHTQNETTFRHLQMFRDARLLRTVNGDHLYDAAMNSGQVRLTGLGRLYWQLARDGRL